MKVRALTIKQPWAYCIARGYKPVENRTWRTPYRGPLAIHAGKEWDSDGADTARRILEQLGIPLGLPTHYLRTQGAVLAVASRVDVCNRSLGSGGRLACECGPWAIPGQFHWQLTEIRPLPEPFKCSGKQGLWEVDLPDFPIGGAR